MVGCRKMTEGSVSKVSISLIGTSHIRRLRDDVRKRADVAFQQDFGIRQVDLAYICGGGWRLTHVSDNLEEIVDSHPDYLIVQAGPNDLARV